MKQFAIIAAVVVAADASDPLLSHDILRMTCGGAAHAFPGSKIEAAVNLEPLVSLVDTFYSAAKAKATQWCPSLTEKEFRRRFVPGLESVINHIDMNDMSSTCDQRGSLLAFYTAFTTNSPWTQIPWESFLPSSAGGWSPPSWTLPRPNPLKNAGGIGLLPLGWVLKVAGFQPETQSFDTYGDQGTGIGITVPESCSYKNLQATGSCTFAVYLSQLSIDLQVAVSNCVDSYWPAISVTCGGAGCPTVFEPCDSDDSCGGKQFCRAPFNKQSNSSIDSFFRSMYMLGAQDNDKNDMYNPGFAQLQKLILAVAPFLGFDQIPDVSSLDELKVCGPDEGWDAYVRTSNRYRPWDDDDAEKNLNFVSDLGCTSSGGPAAYNLTDQDACLRSGCDSVRRVGDGVCDPSCKAPECMSDGNDCHTSAYPDYGPQTRTQPCDYPWCRPQPLISNTKTTCTSLRKWDGTLMSGGKALSKERMEGADLMPTAATPESSARGRNLFFLNCDGSMGINPANSLLAFGARIPFLNPIVSALSGWVEQFTLERFAANSMSQYLTGFNGFRQQFQVWTPFPWLQWSTAAEVAFPFQNPLTTPLCAVLSNGQEACGPTNLCRPSSGQCPPGSIKPFALPSQSTCTPSDFAAGQSCDVNWKHLTALFGEDVADVTASVQQCASSSLPRIAVSVSGPMQDIVAKPQACKDTEKSTDCRAPLQCVDIKKSLTDTFKLGGTANPLDNVLWGAYDYTQGFKGSDPDSWFSFLHAYIEKLGGDPSGDPSSSDLTFCMPQPGSAAWSKWTDNGFTTSLSTEVGVTDLYASTVPAASGNVTNAVSGAPPGTTFLAETDKLRDTGSGGGATPAGIIGGAAAGALLVAVAMVAIVRKRRGTAGAQETAVVTADADQMHSNPGCDGEAAACEVPASAL